MKIYSKEIPKKTEDLIIKLVQEKKELSNFSEKYILKYSEHLLKKNKKLLDILLKEDFNKKEFKIFIKEIREKARRIYGTYITKKYNKKSVDLDIEELLQLHLSTKERFGFYKEIYKKIIEITGMPKSVLDLACGFNPIAKNYISNKKIKYVASDISEKDVKFITNYVDEAFIADLSEKSEIKKITKYRTDWCLLFKALDPIEESCKNVTYDLIPAISSKWIIVSFPTLTLSRKRMRNPQRSWFEKVLNRLEKKFYIFEINNEIFYIIENK